MSDRLSLAVKECPLVFDIMLITKWSQLQQQNKNGSKPLTSMLQKDSHTSFFSFGSREVEQRPPVSIADLRRVSLFQHSPDSADVPRCHCSLDLQLLMKLRVPSAVMVQHPVTFQKGKVYLCVCLLYQRPAICQLWYESVLYISCYLYWTLFELDYIIILCNRPHGQESTRKAAFQLLTQQD